MMDKWTTDKSGKPASETLYAMLVESHGMLPSGHA